MRGTWRKDLRLENGRLGALHVLQLRGCRVEGGDVSQVVPFPLL